MDIELYKYTEQYTPSYNPNLPIHIFPPQEVYILVNPLVFKNLDCPLAEYYVSNYGHVYSGYSNRNLSAALNRDGYYSVALHDKNGNMHTMRVHRIVMMSFCYYPGCEEMFVNHIDGNKTNNMLWNLEWCDRLYNVRHAMATGLFVPKGHSRTISDTQAEEVAQLLSLGTIKINDIAKMTGVSASIVQNISNGAKGYKALHDKYNIPKRNSLTFSDEEVESICQYISTHQKERGSDPRIYMNKVFNALGISYSEKKLDAAIRILYKKSYRNISDKYF